MRKNKATPSDAVDMNAAEKTHQFLKQLIFRIDFSQSPVINREEVVRIHDALKGDFPDIENQTVVNFEVNFDRAERTMKERQIPVVIISNKGRNNRVVFEPTSIIFDIASFDGFKKLLDVVQIVTSAVSSNNPGPIVSRIGLRYINQIILNEGSPFDWKGIIADALLCALDYPQKQSSLTRAMGVLEFEEDDCRVKFQYGMFNSEYPGRITKKEFALDYDCYCLEQTTISASTASLEKFNKLIERHYHRCVAETPKRE